MKTAIGLPRLSWWPWSKKDSERTATLAASSTTMSDSAYREIDCVKLWTGTNTARFQYSPRKGKRKWPSREARKRVDPDYDIVLVPSDGASMSGSESEDSDWSIGWLEPHSSEFLDDDDESNNSFAVLVSCYARPLKDSEATDDRPEKPLTSAPFSFDVPHDYYRGSKKDTKRRPSPLQGQGRQEFGVGR